MQLTSLWAKSGRKLISANMKWLFGKPFFSRWMRRPGGCGQIRRLSHWLSWQTPLAFPSQDDPLPNRKKKEKHSLLVYWRTVLLSMICKQAPSYKNMHINEFVLGSFLESPIQFRSHSLFYNDFMLFSVSWFSCTNAWYCYIPISQRMHILRFLC